MRGKAWVSYVAVKTAVPIERVLERIGHPFVRKPDGHIEAICPIHKRTHRRQFKTTTNGRGFKCFSCGVSGNVLDLVAALEQLELRDAALRLVEWFDLGGSAATSRPRTSVPAGNNKRRQAPDEKGVEHQR